MTHALALRVPGDKSIAHRALLVAALASGESALRGLPEGQDVESTARCLEALGVSIRRSTPADPVWRVRGAGLQGLREPAGDLDCGNSGTTLRLLAGVLAGSGTYATLTGDESLRSRPMLRVIHPLVAMGAQVLHDGGRAPLVVGGGEGGGLTGRAHELEVASAQVKSAILLAGLWAAGETTVVEPVPTRDHTETMLAAAGVEVERKGKSVTVRPARRLRPLEEFGVPGDFSSAAFWLGLGLFGEAPVSVVDVGTNPTRTGFLRILEAAGARFEVTASRRSGGEPVATVTAFPGRPGPLSARGELVVAAIDEIPLAMILSALVPGRSEFRDAAELRVKECDRIDAVARNLERLGARVEEFPDGLAIEGGRPLHAGEVESRGDHRIAMGFAVLAAASGVGIRVQGAEAAAVSYPGFFELLEGALGVQAAA